MKSLSCILRKTGSTIRYTARIALSEYHVIRPPFQGLFLLAKSITPVVACVHSPSPIIKRPRWRAFLPPRQTYHIC